MTKPTLKSILKVKGGYFFTLHNRSDSDTAVVMFGHEEDRFKLEKIAEVSPATYGRALATLVEEHFERCAITRNNYINRLASLKKVIASKKTRPLPSDNVWTRVSTQLPDKHGFYLAAGTGCMDLLYYSNNKQWYYSNDNDLTAAFTVTHWRPLPPAPNHIADASKKVGEDGQREKKRPDI